MQLDLLNELIPDREKYTSLIKAAMSGHGPTRVLFVDGECADDPGAIWHGPHLRVINNGRAWLYWTSLETTATLEVELI